MSKNIKNILCRRNCTVPLSGGWTLCTVNDYKLLKYAYLVCYYNVSQFVIMGDLNIHVDDTDNRHALQFGDILAAYGLKQHVNIATLARTYS